MKRLIFTAIALSSALLVGCASRIQSDDDLQSATAMSLGLQASDVTISNRQDSGTATNYWARTRDGRTFSCVRTATYSMIGTVKSSPLCNPTNGKAQAGPQQGNALTDAYRQMQGAGQPDAQPAATSTSGKRKK